MNITICKQTLVNHTAQHNQSNKNCETQYTKPKLSLTHNSTSSIYIVNLSAPLVHCYKVAGIHSVQTAGKFYRIQDAVRIVCSHQLCALIYFNSESIKCSILHHSTLLTSHHHNIHEPSTLYRLGNSFPSIFQHLL